MRKTIPLTLALVVALASAGCIQNLRDAAGATEESLDQTGEALNQTAAALNATTNATKQAPAQPLKPPVARIAIFGTNGALVYKSDFQAEDAAELVFVDQDSTLNLIASDSEAIERGATLKGFAWSVNGKPIEGGRQASHAVTDAGIHTITLEVTDSNDKRDSQTVRLAVAPKPVEVVTELVTGPVAGAVGQGQWGDATFDLKLDAAGVPATITSVTFVALPGASCDVILDVYDAEGGTIGSADSAGSGGAERVSGGSLPEGTYTVSAGPYTCAAPDGVPVTVTVVYTPIVEGLEDAHGGHDH